MLVTTQHQVWSEASSRYAEPTQLCHTDQRSFPAAFFHIVEDSHTYLEGESLLSHHVCTFRFFCSVPHPEDVQCSSTGFHVDLYCIAHKLAKGRIGSSVSLICKNIQDVRILLYALSSVKCRYQLVKGGNQATKKINQ